MIDATTLASSDLDALTLLLAGEQEPEVLLYGHVVRLRDIGDACHCCDHACAAGESWYEAATVDRVHGRHLTADSDDLEQAIDALRELLDPHRIDTPDGRDRWQLAENARTGLQPALVEVPS